MPRAGRLGVAVLLGALLASCATTGTPSTSSTTSAAPSPSPSSSPSSSTPVSSIDKARAMPAAAAKKVDAAVAAFQEDAPDQSPGLWIAVWDPKLGYYEQAYGDAVRDTTRATVAVHNRIGSITKTVFATAVLQQVATGTLALTDTVGALDPGLASTYPTIGDLTVASCSA